MFAERRHRDARRAKVVIMLVLPTETDIDTFRHLLQYLAYSSKRGQKPFMSM